MRKDVYYSHVVICGIAGILGINCNLRATGAAEPAAPTAFASDINADINADLNAELNADIANATALLAEGGSDQNSTIAPTPVRQEVLDRLHTVDNRVATIKQKAIAALRLADAAHAKGVQVFFADIFPKRMSFVYYTLFLYKFDKIVQLRYF
jgi:hypothetical protein